MAFNTPRWWWRCGVSGGGDDFLMHFENVCRAVTLTHDKSLFTLQNVVEWPLSRTMVENTRQTLCRAFL
jgi:hypothetical protein